jgi:hypothetical protein
MPNLHLRSRFVDFLTRRLVDPRTIGSHQSTLVYRSLRNNAHSMIASRDYLKRLRDAAAKHRIPHPIFGKKYLDLAGFSQIWRAKLLERVLSKMESRENRLVGPKQIKSLSQAVNAYCENGTNFAIMFKSKDQISSTIIMEFIPCEKERMGVVVLHMINHKIGFHSKLTYHNLEKSEIPNFGIIFKRIGVKNPLIQFFYTKRVWTPFDEYTNIPAGFEVDSVEFFKHIPSGIHPPQIISNAACTC